MTIRASRVLALPLAILALLLIGAGSAPTVGKAKGAPLLTQAELFLELNDTDGDLGIHGSIDGGPWTSLEIEGPGERLLLQLFSKSRLQTQGMTQLSFESAEPPFDELPPTEFLRRFPEGRYGIEATAHDGSEFEATAMLSHVLAAPPDNITLSGTPISEACDAHVPLVTTPVMIDWDPVTLSHPEIGTHGQVRINRYQVFVEREGVSLGVDLPPNVTKFEVPTGITALGSEFKFEIIARTTQSNNTALESCFRLR
jgi:hypothetical protein